MTNYSGPVVTSDHRGINVMGKISGLSINDALDLARNLLLMVQSDLNRPWSAEDDSTILTRGEK